MTAAEYTAPAPTSRSSAKPTGSGVLGEVSNVISSARRVATGMVDLVVLEGRRAGLALAWMLGLGVAAAILGVTAWLGLMAVAALALMAAGLSPIWAVLLVVLLNLAVAGGAVFVCVKKSKDLLFTASRRQLSRGSVPAKP